MRTVSRLLIGFVAAGIVFAPTAAATDPGSPQSGDKSSTGSKPFEEPSKPWGPQPDSETTHPPGWNPGA
ncbi:hypothetical protein [Nocardia sp. NPDC050406]|uniref:hypothetical protein n=1 Tax=Nocardia sp. NPDC050406 TaxID=3364318 RepID=UPI0037B50548